MCLGFHQEVRSPHPVFQGAKCVFYGTPPNLHGVRHVFQVRLHLIQDGFILPTFNPSLVTCSATGFQCAMLTC